MKLRGGNILDQTLVDSHLEAIPGLGTLTTGGLTGGDLEDAGRETDGALDAELLGLGTLDEVGGDYDIPICSLISSCSLFRQFSWGGVGDEKRTLLESLDLAGGEGDADAVDLGTFPELALLWLVVRHFGRKD